MIFRTVAFFLLFQSAVWAQQSSLESRVNSTLEVAGDNRVELQKAIDSIKPEMKPGLSFLLAYMPPSDAKTLNSEFLLSHVSGAYEAWQQSPWHSQIDEETFLNYILPYANVSERREQWRSDFRKRFLPLVASAKTPSEAAVLLNQQIFSKLNVKYSTKRKRADQGPFESIEGGTASCTGLSILLIDACRSVGVPARFVGIPRWSDNSGNHSWVEIWDGEWKFTGAAEPNGDDLNKGWFTERASKAQESKTNYAIYAVTYRNTGLRFPMVWQSDFDPVWSINVTNRYIKKAAIPDGHVLVRFRAKNGATQDRVAAKIFIVGQSGSLVFEGQTKDETFDANDHLSVPLPKNTLFKVRYQLGERDFHSEIQTGDQTKLVELNVSADVQSPSR